MNIDLIKSPIELYEYMNNNIKYGFKDQNGNIYNPNSFSFNKNLVNKWVYKNPEDIINEEYGICYDQVLLESLWFKRHNYTFKTYFMIFELPYENNYSTHTFLIYKENGFWYYFENADYKNRGIYRFNNIDGIIKYRIDIQVRENLNNGLTKDEINSLKIYEYKYISSNLGFIQYINEVIKNGKEYIIK